MKFGLGNQNERGERWVQWCDENEQVITNTWFEQHPKRSWTWRSPDWSVKNQVDYITINERFRNSEHLSKTYPSADCGRDHVPVVCQISVKLKKLKKARAAPKRQYDTLQTNSVIKHAYNVEVRNRFEVLTNVSDNGSWDALKKSLVSAAEDVIPPQERKTHNKWMTEEILGLMGERQKISNRKSQEYREMDNVIKS